MIIRGTNTHSHSFFLHHLHHTMDNPNSSSCIEEATCTGSASPLQRVGSGDSSAILDPDAAAGGGVAEAESRKLPSSQYKGVVPQPNGRWGAQIYEKHQRVWLGTFNDEPDAARAYDVAAQRFRGRDAVTNFKPLSESNDSDSAELDFLARHSKSEIVDMLRKHTYADELHQSKRAFTRTSAASSSSSGNQLPRGNQVGCAREHLFDKTVTPSDVGKLNRLVIPKQHAQKHFPLKMDASSSSGCKGILLNFEDSVGKVWRFRYSYWNSSQSYVLTKGWSRFVKEKSLQAGDVVSFRRTISDAGEKQLCIECRPRATARPVEVVRLFGVDIFKVPAAVEIEQIHAGIKRSRDLDLGLGLGLDRLMKSNSPKFLVKKQCVLGAF